ncbi:hypothetical protein BACFRA24663_10100 [Bacteroides fragilis]
MDELNIKVFYKINGYIKDILFHVKRRYIQNTQVSNKKIISYNKAMKSYYKALI